MATETAFRPRVDQENASALDIKGGNVSGRSFGAAKSFQSDNAPLTTPRRALGDVGNTIKPSTTKARKGLALKPNKLMGKKSTTTKIFQDRAGTPATKGLPLLQQISSAGLKQSSKKKQAIHVKTTEKQRVKAEQDQCQKETMLPFTDKEDALPRPSYVSAILRNVGALYYGCQFRPQTGIDSDSEDDPANFVHFENERRPKKDTYFDSLPFEGELDLLTQGFDTLSLPDIELPPIDIDSLGLGLL
ncbi:uncharacterized protein LOC110039993 [Orbicella faveolata]|uniref:uncharacterized protein LOC110039993 n=1 Tax=Orbicella faveolata TaxID=48498 RepID=UPI0009E32F6C|nr:uncharacterized protein LOC110039993 [Orbicella faveolata]